MWRLLILNGVPAQPNKHLTKGADVIFGAGGKTGNGAAW